MAMEFPFIKPVDLPSPYHVHDFEKLCTNGECHHTHSLGRYNENRDFYLNNESRTIHLGIDFGAPAGTDIFAVSDCTVYYKCIFPSAGDYGPMIVTENRIASKTVYCLYAHLETESFNTIQEGQTFKQGERLARVGAPHENGNWSPHLHFQICTERPEHGENIPGVWNVKDLAHALRIHPDPQIYFGKLY